MRFWAWPKMDWNSFVRSCNEATAILKLQKGSGPWDYYALPIVLYDIYELIVVPGRTGCQRGANVQLMGRSDNRRRGLGKGK